MAKEVIRILNSLNCQLEPGTTYRSSPPRGIGFSRSLISDFWVSKWDSNGIRKTNLGLNFEKWFWKPKSWIRCRNHGFGASNLISAQKNKILNLNFLEKSKIEISNFDRARVPILFQDFIFATKFIILMSICRHFSKISHLAVPEYLVRKIFLQPLLAVPFGVLSLLLSSVSVGTKSPEKNHEK